MVREHEKLVVELTPKDDPSDAVGEARPAYQRAFAAQLTVHSKAGTSNN